ncbi:MAG: sensor histidine kinase [Chthoniobacterales bacterium]
MAENLSPAEGVLQALGYALFVREDSGVIRLAGVAPAWLMNLWPQVADGREALDAGISPFLDNFLIDAEDCWRAAAEKRALSGPWIEQDSLGENVQLEATALTLAGQSVLLLERLGEAFEAKKSLLQKARENVIAYQRLNSEVQKKEILLHCVAEDMTAALANIVTSLRLLELENSSAKGRMLLGLASRATAEQQALIHKVLSVFAEELSGLFGQNGDGETASDLRATTRLAIAAMSAQLAEKNVRLRAPTDSTEEITLPLDARHLERVVTNLIENALEHTPAGGEISVAIDDETDAAVLRVEDNGPAVPADTCENLFAKLEPVAGVSQAPLLRLHFCRMMAEGLGGEIGCTTRDGGGNRFWIRLPKNSR